MTDAQAGLLEFTVPCGYSDVVEGFELVCINGKVSMDGQVNSPHNDCHGSGVRYPFRLACPVGAKYVKDSIHGHYEHGQTCCSGLGYIFNDSPQVLWQAVRDRGWIGAFDQGQADQGDMVFSWSLRDDGRYDERIGFVSNGSTFIPDSGPDEGLRGQDALETALHRADLATKEA